MQFTVHAGELITNGRMCRARGPMRSCKKMGFSQMLAPYLEGKCKHSCPATACAPEKTRLHSHLLPFLPVWNCKLV